MLVYNLVLAPFYSVYYYVCQEQQNVTYCNNNSHYDIDVCVTKSILLLMQWWRARGPTGRVTRP